MTKNEIKNIKFVVRTDVDDKINVSELEVNPDEIDELTKLLEETKELIFYF